MSLSTQTIPTDSPSEAVRPASRAVLAVALTAWALGCLGLLWILVDSGQVGPAGLWLKYSPVAAPALMAGASYLLWHFGRSAGTALLMIFLLTVALVILFGIWETGESNYYFLGGLLPFSDAQGYYGDALRLQHGWRFSEFSSRRPLFPAFLAVLLALTGRSLPLALILLAGISVLALGLAARAVQRHLGTAAGILLLLCLFMFFRRYIGATLTEHLGLAWGCLAFCFLWHGAALQRPTPVLIGLFLLAIGLSARAGAFLVIPAIILWAGLQFHGPNRRGLKVAAGALAAALLGVGASAVLLRITGVPGAAFSNFSYTLYGLVFGGDWLLALRQHPELTALSELERTGRIYELAWEGIRDNPLALASGAWRAWMAFLWGGTGAWHAFVQNDVWPAWTLTPPAPRPDEWQAVAVLRTLWGQLDATGQRLWVLGLHAGVLAGACALWRNRRTAWAGLTAAAWVGIFVSVPFAPPWDADNMRAYATTLPFLGLLPALGALLVRRVPAPGAGSGSWRGLHGMPDMAVFAVVLLLVQFLGPLAILATRKQPHAATGGSCARPCEAGRLPYLVEVQPRNAVHLVEAAEAGAGAGPGNRVTVQDFRAHSLLGVNPELRPLGRGLASLGANITLALAFDHRQGGTRYLLGRTADFPRSSGMAAFCGQPLQLPTLEWVRVDAWGGC